MQRTTDELRSLLPSFRKYLDDLPRTDSAAAGLFNSYGSHFLTGIVMGGRAVLSSATNKLQIDRTYPLEETAKAAYQSLTGQLSASEQVKYQQSIASFNSYSDSREGVLGAPRSPGSSTARLVSTPGRPAWRMRRTSSTSLPRFR